MLKIAAEAGAGCDTVFRKTAKPLTLKIREISMKDLEKEVIKSVFQRRN
jgi:hypothetical protein